MRTSVLLPILMLLGSSTILLATGCGERCERIGACTPYSGTLGGGGEGGDGGNGPGGGPQGGGGEGGMGGDGGTGGEGGNPPCGGACDEPTPLCDEQNNVCVACLSDEDCDTVGASQCDAGACVPCSDSTQCSHLTGTQVCDVGTCVECALGDEVACGAGTSCDLLAKTCTGPSPGSVQNCNVCTNDLQCAAGHRCIEMDFDGSSHGYYCLKDSAGGCAQPFVTPINNTSISGAGAVNYCGIEEDSATCEAVLALINNWRCSGADGMCSPDGIQPEVTTPGALCRQVGLAPNRCTYECAGAVECLSSGPAATCGGAPSPTWCGG
jgi:hypothetical protein